MPSWSMQTVGAGTGFSLCSTARSARSKHRRDTCRVSPIPSVSFSLAFLTDCSTPLRTAGRPWAVCCRPASKWARSSSSRTALTGTCRRPHIHRMPSTKSCRDSAFLELKSSTLKADSNASSLSGIFNIALTSGLSSINFRNPSRSKMPLLICAKSLKSSSSFGVGTRRISRFSLALLGRFLFSSSNARLINNPRAANGSMKTLITMNTTRPKMRAR
mmetsp:Transcript_26121/g.59065  ORF Transcript_26121/g.59065 Transcript_26121/m.59065 type:complete len:217 (-) Transcript_26121:1300-1950(-)